jgi:ParB family transcriptional regulator, chromosome partitioning protein
MISADASSVRVSEIDCENSMFRITARPNDEALVRSIETVGLIHAPLLLATESGFVVVSGFKRIEACVRLGFKIIPAAVLKPGTSMLECARLAIADNMYQRELNGVEISHALNLLSGIIGEADHLSRIAESLGLPSDPRAIEKIRSVTQLPENLQKGIIAQRVALPVAFALGNLETDSANSLSQIFTGLNLSINRQREILALVKDISAREGIPIKEVLEESGLRKIFSQNESDHGEIARQMRIYLKRRRFPAICRKEEAFNSYVKSLKLPRNTKLLAPDHFEGMTYMLQFSFKNSGELASCRRAFERVLSHPDTPAVFE